MEVIEKKPDIETLRTDYLAKRQKVATLKNRHTELASHAVMAARELDAAVVDVNRDAVNAWRKNRSKLR